MGATSLELNVGTSPDKVTPFLASFEYSETLDALDALHANLTFPAGDEGAKLLDLVKVGSPFELVFYEEGSKVRAAAGDIVRTTLRRGRGTGWSLHLIGLETLHRLKDVRVTEVFDQSKDQIVGALVKKAGLTADAMAVPSTTEEVVLFDEPALVVLKRFADERNFTLRAEDRKLHFAPRDKAASGRPVEVTWTENIDEVELTTSLEGVVTGVKVIGRDRTQAKDWGEKGQLLVYEAKDTDLAAISGGDNAAKVRKAAFGELLVVLPEEENVGLQSTVEERAKAELQRRADRFIEGSVTTPGQPRAALGQRLEIKGLQWPLTGPFLIHRVDHAVDGPGDYTSRIWFSSDSLPKKT